MDKAEQVRAELKAKGFNRADVGVRMRHSNSLIVEIRKESVPYNVVNDIAREHKDIEYDAHTMEIMSGSFFVNVRISDALSDEFKNRYKEQIQAFLNSTEDKLVIDKYIIKQDKGEYGVRVLSADYEHQDCVTNNAGDISEYLCKLNMGMNWGTRS